MVTKKDPLELCQPNIRRLNKRPMISAKTTKKKISRIIRKQKLQMKGKLTTNNILTIPVGVVKCDLSQCNGTPQANGVAILCL
jgi:hypothetical protein